MTWGVIVVHVVHFGLTPMSIVFSGVEMSIVDTQTQRAGGFMLTGTYPKGYAPSQATDRSLSVWLDAPLDCSFLPVVLFLPL